MSLPTIPPVQIPVGGSLMLHPMFLDQNGRALQPQPAASTVTFSSDAPAVATVDATGKVSAVSTGSANISATSGSISASKAISVYVPIAAKIIL